MDTPAATAGPVHYLNVEYFFRLLYEAVFSIHGTTFQAGFIALITHIWIVVGLISIVVTIGLLIVFVFCTIRFHQIYEAELAGIAPIDPAKAEHETEHHRWNHVMELIESPHENDWRQAIIEADIILEDMLTTLGLPGDTIGDKLKAASPNHFHTLQDAWAAHQVRNNIAHQGSTYQLSDQIAYRTIKQYEGVFREHNEI